jgi:hypothetical protein
MCTRKSTDLVECVQRKVQTFSTPLIECVQGKVQTFVGGERVGCWGETDDQKFLVELARGSEDAVASTWEVTCSSDDRRI